MPPSSSSPSLEFHLPGTGTSSSVPSIDCLTSPTQGCHSCRSTLGAEPGSEQAKNVRRNTSGLLRIPPRKAVVKDGDGEAEADERWKTVLVDCGKTFYSAALQHWPKHNLRQIDALLITHAHADAFLGLDDLRGWTLHGSIQTSIPIYATKETGTGLNLRSSALSKVLQSGFSFSKGNLELISEGYFNDLQCFPYLADRSKATGGGDVPAFDWHIFSPSEPLHLFGIEIIPLPVHHGKIFSTPPQPYLSLGFLFDRQIAYISDVSYIPEETWSILETHCCAVVTDSNPSNYKKEEGEGEGEGEGNPSPSSSSSRRQPAVLILDTLRSTTFTSHYGIGEAVSTLRRFGAFRTYLIGFAHGTSHSTWVKTCERISTGEKTFSPILLNEENKEQKIPVPPPYGPSPSSYHLLPSITQSWFPISGSSIKGFEDPFVHAQWALRIIEAFEPEKIGEKGWVRPGADGMVLKVFDDEDGVGGVGRVTDDLYDV
ncbi:BQ2448_4390 [Microbotryum intermedium]|uniref:BQ2448_4390 protein n=1 Tax=Microbotryum intermedium TaxID=269621 RepID=A0A238FLF9_9BASI|nr:BQ2448_4390 [Microbotryum intermedium]